MEADVHLQGPGENSLYVVESTLRATPHGRHLATRVGSTPLGSVVVATLDFGRLPHEGRRKHADVNGRPHIGGRGVCRRWPGATKFRSDHCRVPI